LEVFPKETTMALWLDWLERLHAVPANFLKHLQTLSFPYAFGFARDAAGGGGIAMASLLLTEKSGVLKVSCHDTYHDGAARPSSSIDL
jgi:hypothetical protein